MLETGRNCWRIETAVKATVIVDADDYFRAARSAMLKAKRQILLVGWDFDARICFKDDCTDDGPEQLGAFISWLTQRTPTLQVHILRWDTGALKSLIQPSTLYRIARWIGSKQIHLRLDGNHPVGGSHHQKVLVIDDDVAFCGGIDITANRWDTRAHRDDDERRVGPGGRPYHPWHDATTVLQGPVARALGEMCRARWEATGARPAAPESDAGDRWPDDVRPDFAQVEVAIARTVPEMDAQEPHHEIEALYVDLIARARKWIYAESQYFASRKVAEAVGKRLAEPDGPEVVIVHPVTAQGWLEPVAMDSARARLVEALRAQDPDRRLRLYHPFTAGGEPIYVHAKVTVIDDDVLRVGSSNFNNRSLRLDTECDIVIDAGRQDEARTKRVIAGIRDSLLAEHLDTDCETIEATLAATGSLIATIERLRGDGRSLRPYVEPDLGAVQAWLADNKILDPEGPGEMFEAVSARRSLVPPRFRRDTGKLDPTTVGIGMGVAVAGTAAVAGLVALLARRRSDRRLD